MRYQLTQKNLGNTNIRVSELCLGILPMGPLQADLPAERCIGLIKMALELGVTFFDTAEFYNTQAYLGDAVKPERNNVVIATKSTALSYDEMSRSVERSLVELQTDYIDIYHLHAARPPGNLFKQRKGALQCLLKMKLEGVIKAVGVSTHKPLIVDQAAERDDIDIIYPLVNSRGMGIVEGTLDDMLAVIEKARRADKGLYAMKVLAGGNLVGELEQAVNWVRGIKGMDAVSIGVVSEEELRYNLSIFDSVKRDGKPPAPPIKTKKLFIFKKVCNGCGSCVEICPNSALSLVGEKARVDHGECILCGYCSPECPRFAIRLV